MTTNPTKIEFRPSRMPGMRSCTFELTDVQLALRNMQVAPDIVVPLDRVTSAEVDPDPIGSIRRFSAVKGRKVIPGLNPLVVCSLDEGRQFFAIKGGRDALAVDVEGLQVQRVTVLFPDPAAMVERIGQATGST